MRKKKSFAIISSSLLLMAIAIIALLNQKPQNKRMAYENFLNSVYQELPDITPTELGEMDKMDRPDVAGWRDYVMMMDPETKEIPSDGKAKAYQATREIRNANRFKNDQSVNIWKEDVVDMGGRTRTLMFDPNDANGKKAWAGSVTGGLWYSNDPFHNEGWIPVNDFMDNMAISCLTYDPNNTTTFYMGTGESQTALVIYRESSGRGSGIYKSDDGGSTWNVIPSTEDFAYVSDIVVRNEDGQSVIYAGVLSGRYRGKEHQSEPTDGLYRSDNGGESWTQVLPNIEGENVPYAVADIELGADGKLYVGTTFNLEDKGGACILMSDNGTDWDAYTYYNTYIPTTNDYPYPGRIMLGASPSNANIVYAGVVAGRDNAEDGFRKYHNPYIIKTTNKGETWTEINKPNNNSKSWTNIPWHALVFKVDPNNPNRCFVGGMELFVTNNGGGSWLRLTNWAAMYGGNEDKYVHADIHSIQYQPGSSKKIIIGTDGGIFGTMDAEQTYPVFMEINEKYNTLQYYSCDIHPDAGARHYIGGLQDNGTMFYGNEETTTYRNMLSGGDGAICFIDKDHPTIHFTSVYYNAWYKYTGTKGVKPNYTGYGGHNNGTFVNPADYESLNNTIFANAMETNGNNRDRLLIIDNAVADLDGRVVSLNTGSTVPFSSVRVAPGASEGNATVFLGSQSGGLFKIADAHHSVLHEEIGSENFPTAWISSIDVDASQDTLILTFSNYDVQHVWMTTDGGTNWRCIDGNLPNMPVRWVIFHPETCNSAMIATEFGVWRCDNLIDDEVVWSPAVNGLANVRVDMIKVRPSDNTVLAATHGRGMFTCTWEPISMGIGEKEISTVELKAYPNPSDGALNIRMNFNGKVRIEVLDVRGQLMYQENIESYAAGSEMGINLSQLSKGTYFLRAINGNKSASQKLLIK